MKRREFITLIGGAAVAWCLSADAAARARELGWREVRELPAEVPAAIAALVAGRTERRHA